MNALRNFWLSILLLTPCAASSDSVVVFNEIMYHPASDEQSEWIELHNQMSVDIDLSRWSLEGGVDFKFAEGTIIPGGGYLVIASDPEGMENALGPFTGRLANGGETLRLKSASDRLMNRVRYRDDGDWPAGADGSGASLAKVHGDSAAQEAANWSWSAEVGGSPGAVNFSEDVVPQRPLRINEVAGESEAGIWVELVNAGDTDIALDGHVLVQPTTGIEHVLEAGSLAPGAFLLLGAETLPGGAASGDLLFLYSPEKRALVDAIEIKTRSRGRFPDGGDDLVFTSQETPAAANVLAFHDEIVINEILYHHRPQYRTDEVPFKEIDKEWLELYHRGDAMVDMSGWELDGDINYVFPQGTTLEPGAYLVIENGDGITGFEDNLPNGSGHVELKDAMGNIVDEVSYFDDGDWPKVADGGGSSLELRDPRADNTNPQAWAPSDESAHAEWQEIRYRGVAEPSEVGPDNEWRELVIGLLDRGEVLIDDIRVTEDPDGLQVAMLSNGSFKSSIFGGGPLRSWRPRGNHRHSEIVPDPDDPDNDVLRILATGATGHMHNQIETTFSGTSKVTNGTTYEISFRARALSGSPQLLTRLYFNRLPKTHILKTPDSIGTPGSANSRLEPNIGPSLSHLNHSPAVPAVDEACAIHVQAADPDGVAELNLFWSVNGEAFTETPMMASEAGDYSALIPAQEAGDIVQFYVQAEDTLGALSYMPAKAEQSRALFQVEDDRGSDPVLNHFRIIMRPDDTEWMHEAINLMSNDRIPATVIYKEKEIFYNVGVRLKGSERGRVTNARIGFNVKFPTQQRFRGIHRTVAVDRSEGVGTGQFEMLFNQMMTHSGGIPAEYNDLIHVISPRAVHTGPAELQLARYGSIFLDSQFDNGSDGHLYEFELIYYPTTADGDGYKRPSPDLVDRGGTVKDLGDDPENYRWTYLLKNKRKRDDFSPIMRFGKLFSKPDAEFQAELEDVIDVDGWLQGMAFALLTGAGDQYGSNSGHNGMFYAKPDGKIVFFPHDVDFAFSPSRSITENTELKDIIKNPANKRIYLAHLNNIITTTFNESYMTRWANHFGELLPGQNFDNHLNYVIDRSKNAKTQVSRMAPNVAFKIQTEGGPDFIVDTLSAEIQGTGALDLHRLIHIETGDVYTPEWLDLETWKINLTLQPGENVFTLQGVNILGGTGSIFAPVGRGEITITSTAGPVEGDTPAVRNLDVALEGGTTVLLSYERALDEGLSVTPEISSDLVSWIDLPDPAETVEALAGDDSYEAVMIRFQIEPGNADHIRLRIDME